MIKISLITVVIAFCSIVYELGFGYGLTLLYGNSVLNYSLTIGLYLASLGLGSILIRYLKEKLNFLKVEIGLFILGISSMPFLFYTGIYFDETIAKVLNFAYIILIGILSGMEIPLLTKGLVINNKEEKTDIYNVLSIDYIGALLGSILFSLIFIQKLGLVTTIISVSLLNLFLTLFLINNKIYKGIVATLIISILVSLNQFDFDKYTMDKYMKRLIEKKEFCNERNCEAKLVKSFFTPYQFTVDAEIKYNNPYGENTEDKKRCTYIDGYKQYCSNFIETYHSMLIDIPLLLKDNKNLNVLLIGGGDLFAVKHLIENNVSNITHIELDKDFYNYHIKNSIVKDKTIEELQKGTKINNSNYKIVFDDGYHFIQKDNNKYDLIIVDLPALTNEKLVPVYSNEFFTLLNISLKQKGLLITYHENNFDRIKLASQTGFKYSYIYKGFFIDKDKKIKLNKKFNYLDIIVILTKDKLNNIQLFDKNKNIYKPYNLNNSLINLSVNDIDNIYIKEVNIEKEYINKDKEKYNSVLKPNYELINKKEI